MSCREPLKRNIETVGYALQIFAFYTLASFPIADCATRHAKQIGKIKLSV